MATDRSDDFDYIVVGGGTAGCIVASRLSETGRVLLLEAGGRDNSILIDMPVGFALLLAKGLMDWGYVTEKQLGLDGRALPWPRGKVLGGSHSINAMLYLRGDRGDYDGWAAAGCPGWSYEECLPYFVKAEDWQNCAGDHSHGHGGPLGITKVSPANPLSKAWIEAGRQGGYPFNPDYYGSHLEGFGHPAFTIRDGRRASTSSAYLRPFHNRSNLTVETGARATKVLVENGRASGVVYVQKGKLKRACASAEVVLSGGTINSPMLLMHSGIGDGDQLRSLGMDVAIDLPGVGRNLQDHLQSAIRWEVTKPVSMYRDAKPLRAAANMLRYLLFRSGPNSRMGLESLAFIRSDPSDAAPDLQFYCSPYLFNEGALTLAKRHGFTIFYNQARPRSRGQLMLRSADPLAKPVIQPNYLSQEADVLAMRRGFRLAREIVGQAAFDDLRGEELAPGRDVTSDADIDAWNRRTATSVYHPVGTCRMGSDAEAVVDAELKVRGVEGLRVIDASVMPSLVSANTNGATIMIAEKGADFLLGKQMAPRREQSLTGDRNA